MEDCGEASISAPAVHGDDDGRSNRKKQHSLNSELELQEYHSQPIPMSASMSESESTKKSNDNNDSKNSFVSTAQTKIQVAPSSSFSNASCTTITTSNAELKEELASQNITSKSEEETLNPRYPETHSNDKNNNESFPTPPQPPPDTKESATSSPMKQFHAFETTAETESLLTPLNPDPANNANTSSNTTDPNTMSSENSVRSRKKITFGDDVDEVLLRNNSNHNNQSSITQRRPSFHNVRHEKMERCCHHIQEIPRNVLRNTITVMNFLARILFWASLVALIVLVVWYSRELSIHGTDPHLVAWFSAGAFVILGFPISIYGILMHLTNYYQPNVQCYVVRILWMVPIYSIESWLCLRFHEFAIYIETLRDCYESFVLYCFLQFLIEVLGGEEALILLLKDKSPTRGFHYVPMNWCLKPWIMGQPVSAASSRKVQNNSGGVGRGGGTALAGGVLWTSPFFVQCKFGCLQYVLLKFVSSIFVMVLEVYGLYKEGDFTTKGGYLYICILTNLSQCWALYCMIIFYYATKNELSPIRPVGKFLSVKALVFFTWWQSVAISILFQMDLIPNYQDGWTAEDVAKGIQAYLICIEMFLGAIVHTFVFPHTDYLKPIVVGKNTGSMVSLGGGKRLGRRGRNFGYMHLKDDRSRESKTSNNSSLDQFDLEHQIHFSYDKGEENDSPTSHDMGSRSSIENQPIIEGGSSSEGDHGEQPVASAEQERTGFTSALFDSIVPRDVMDNTVAIARGDFKVEKKTLLYHAAASDEYSLFAKRRAMKVRKKQDLANRTQLKPNEP